MKTVAFLLLFLTSTLVLPLGFSSVQATDQSNDTNQTSVNMGNSTENVGQEISNFVHNATAVFKQQKDETVQAIKDCHEKMKTATSDNRTQIIDECHSTLDKIREKYQDMRKQFQDLFKQFRESIITLRHHEEGLQVSEQDRDDAIKKINDDAAKHGMAGLKIAYRHVMEMGANGTRGIERAMHNVNETDEYGNHTRMSSVPEDHDQGMHGPPMSPGQSNSHGK